MTAPALAVVATTVVEVVRATERTTGDLVATFAAGVATAGLVALAVLLVTGWQRAGRAAVVATTTLASVAVVVAVLALATVADAQGSALFGRRGLAATAQLLAGAALATTAVVALRAPAALRDADRRTLAVAFGLAAVAAAPLAMPGSGDASGLVSAVGLVAVLAATVAVVVLVLARAGRVVVVGTLAAALVAGGMLGTFGSADPGPKTHHAEVVVDGLTFDVTVAPVLPGRNELHLYVWEPDGAPAAVDEVGALVRSPSGAIPSEMLAVSPNHHLSYELLLADDGPWELELSARLRGAADPLVLSVPLEAS